MSEVVLTTTQFGAGPWSDEPNQLLFPTSAGLIGLILRHPDMGHLCGYVAVPESHPLFGVKIHTLPGDLEVHGGVSLSDHIKGLENDDIWWIGFDCAHAWDFIPYWQCIPGIREHIPVTDYRDIDYVRKEVENLADQIAAQVL